MGKPVEYNRSENATRPYKVTRQGGFHGLGKRTVDILCPFCGWTTQAYLWSLSGGGKVCINRKCGAKHNSYGTTIPRVGREEMNP